MKVKIVTYTYEYYATERFLVVEAETEEEQRALKEWRDHYRPCNGRGTSEISLIGTDQKQVW